MLSTTRAARLSGLQWCKRKGATSDMSGMDRSGGGIGHTGRCFSSPAPPRWSLPFDVYHISPVTGWNVMPTLLRIPAHKQRSTCGQPRRQRRLNDSGHLHMHAPHAGHPINLVAGPPTQRLSRVPRAHLRRTPGGRCRLCECAQWCSTSQRPGPRRHICAGGRPFGVRVKREFGLETGEGAAGRRRTADTAVAMGEQQHGHAKDRPGDSPC